MKARLRIFTILQGYKRAERMEHPEMARIPIAHGWAHVSPDITPEQVQALNSLAEAAYRMADQMREVSEVLDELKKNHQLAERRRQEIDVFVKGIPDLIIQNDCRVAQETKRA